MKIIKKNTGILYSIITSVGLVFLGELFEYCGLYKGHQVLSPPSRSRRQIHQPSRINMADAQLATNDAEQATVKNRLSNENV